MLFASSAATLRFVVAPGSAGRKTYVLDTCVLLADPTALLRFEEHHVVVPLVVVEELDRKKTRMDEVGTNARRTIRLLEDHGASRAGGLREAISLPSGGTLRIEPNGVRSQRLPEILDATTPDHRLLSVCLNLDDEGGSSVLVTKDAALRIKGAQLGVQVQDYRADTVAVDESYSGVSEIEVDNDFVDRLYAEGKAVVAAAGRLVNQYVVLRAPDGQSAVAQVVQSEPETIVVRVPGSRRTFGIESKNLRQAFAMDLLLNPDVHAVSIMGAPGTGKTFLALAAGLEQVVEAGRYRKVSVYRPLVAVGRQELGYLPGDLEEKLSPWMAAVHDNLFALFANGGPRAARDAVEELIDRDELEMAAITYLRGRSITGEYVIIDEAQNLELSTLKVILTRMSSDSKVVLCGDFTQVDNPYVSPMGGAAALVEKLKGSPLFGHVTLERTVRSPLAELASTLL
ncbi:MAG TPA: PhoH family protein [Acidimicrobiia bacterium]|nr:PhoH family protein [Acidimicrobiia bacterium]